MLSRCLAFFFILCLSSKIFSQISDAKNLTKDLRVLEYSDPEKALKTAQYIISNQSFGTREEVFDALLTQSEIYYNLQNYSEAVLKLISAGKFSQSVDNNFLKSKNEYIIGKLYLELGFKDEYNAVIKNISDQSKSIKNEDERKCVEAWVHELEILKLYQEKNYKVCLAKINYQKNLHLNFDPSYNSRLQVFKSKIKGNYSNLSTSTENYFKFLQELNILKSKIENGTFKKEEVSNVKKKFGQYSGTSLYLDLYKVWSEKACNGNSADCFTTRSEYIKILKSSLLNRQQARANMINLIDQKGNFQVLEKNDYHKKILTVTLALAVTALIISLIYYFSFRSKANLATVKFEKENISREYEQKLNDQLKDFQASNIFSIPERTESLILTNLEAFEKTDHWRDPSLSLSGLAKHLSTNPKYLSEVINKHKGKNFNNYLNEMRVNYIVDKLTHNPEYLQYKTSYLAEEAGFASRTTFTTIFKSVTGKSPSQVIDELKSK